MFNKNNPTTASNHPALQPFNYKLFNPKLFNFNPMIRFLLPIFLLLAAFPLAAQGCYQNLQNGAGVSADPSRASTIACKLRESPPEANRASFATYSASLYRFAGNFAPGAAEALVTRLEARAAAASPYYLLIVWEASEDNLFATPHVRVKLPADGPFTCLNPLRRSAWQARLLLQAQGDAPKAKDPEDYLRAETKLMEELSGYVKDLIKCCQQGQTCPDCITRKERIALLKAFPFRTIGQTTYNPAALKYRVDNVPVSGGGNALIRDGIGISLDLGGGPINIAEKLKQLAQEKPELGLNALIVHDSLLCDPELLPGKFFGGPGLRSVGSQGYFILVNEDDKATGEKTGVLKMVGDNDSALNAILQSLLVGVETLEEYLPPSIASEENSSLCGKGEVMANAVFYTPTKALIKFILPVSNPRFAFNTSEDPEGTLLGFDLDGKTYTTIYIKNSREFVDYVESKYFDGLKANNDIIDSKLKNTNEWKNHTLKLSTHYTLPTGPELIRMKWQQNSIALKYEFMGSSQGEYYSAIKNGTILPSTIEDCEYCTHVAGPGRTFYEENISKSDDPAYKNAVCQIAARFNDLGKIVYQSIANGDWDEKGFRHLFGKHFDAMGGRVEEMLKYNAALKTFSLELKEVQEKFKESLQNPKYDQLLYVVCNLDEIYVKLIDINDRIKVLKMLLSKDLIGKTLFTRPGSEEAVIKLITWVNDEDKIELFKFLKKDQYLNIFFTNKGYNDFLFRGNFQIFTKAFFDLWLYYAQNAKISLNEIADCLIFLSWGERVSAFDIPHEGDCSTTISATLNEDDLTVNYEVDIPDILARNCELKEVGPAFSSWNMRSCDCSRIDKGNYPFHILDIVTVKCVETIPGFENFLSKGTITCIPAFMLQYIGSSSQNEATWELIYKCLTLGAVYWTLTATATAEAGSLMYYIDVANVVAADLAVAQMTAEEMGKFFGEEEGELYREVAATLESCNMILGGTMLGGGRYPF
jgi:hypothetical protein